MLSKYLTGIVIKKLYFKKEIFMNFVKKLFKTFFVTFFIILLGFNKVSIAANFDYDFLDDQICVTKDIEDDFDCDFDTLFDDNNPTIGDYLDNQQFDITRKTDAKTILELLVSVDAQKLLQEYLFLKTNILNKRSLLDNPLFIMNKRYDYGTWVLGCTLFFEQTTRMHFTKPCNCSSNRKYKYETASCIKTYLGITQPSLLSILTGIEEKIIGDFGVEIFSFAKALRLFENATAQERRAGFFFSLMGQYKKIDFRFKVPFYYSIRNFYLTDEEQTAISNEFGESDDEEGLRFARNHLISDRLGLGDLRFEFDFPIGCPTTEEMHFKAGAFATIPTAVSMVKGLYGQVFCPQIRRPKIDFVEIFDLAQNDNTRCQAIEIGKNFALNALNGISSMLIDTDLGNNRHFGLGVLLKTKTPVSSIFNRWWTRNLYFKGKMTVEYLFPAMEYRWFVEECKSELFEQYDFEDVEEQSEAQAANTLAFLEKMFVDMFYPYVYKTKVAPGFIFMWASKLTYEAKRWGIHVGWDTWLQSREVFDEICAPSSQIGSLDIEKARRPWGYQWNVFGSLFYKKQNKKSRLYIGLNGEVTVSSRGIGKPFKLTLSFERDF